MNSRYNFVVIFFSFTLLHTLPVSAQVTAQLVGAQIQNGGFESWSNNQPTDWTTIDSGISVDQVSSPVADGNSAAKITVTTATQSNTDLQQTVAVQAGQTVQFSASVYHTDGGVRARLVVDGYQLYSDPSLRNQWQQLQHSYTSTQNQNITVGLRFYDVAGFDGSEVVYVDDFQPSSNSTPRQTAAMEPLL